MDFIQTAIDFIANNWSEIVAVGMAAYAVYLKGQKLYYSFKYGSVKMYQKVNL